MKKYLMLLSIVALLFCSCSKNADSNINSYAGSYTGNINAYINGTYHSTLNNHTLTLTSTNTPGQVTLGNNVIMTTSASISGTTLSIPRTVAVTSASFNGVEYGTGTFSGNTLTIEFHQDQVNPTTNAVMGSGKWTGELTKQ